MLEIRGLKKRFGGREILQGVDLDVHGGEAVALLGGNGSGKTTTLRSIVGLVIPDDGTILIGGVNARRRPRDARTRLSYLSQKSVFPATLTVREILEAVARLRGAPTDRASEEIERCLLSAVADHASGTLSGGERQRLGLAAAFLPDVELYLFDEPSANLDAIATEIFMVRAAALVEAGKSVLFTSHVAADVERLATRTVELRDGRLAGRPSILAPARPSASARGIS
jgi:ABC-type multidrug transport system ATPase subunit